MYNIQNTNEWMNAFVNMSTNNHVHNDHTTLIDKKTYALFKDM